MSTIMTTACIFRRSDDDDIFETCMQLLLLRKCDFQNISVHIINTRDLTQDDFFPRGFYHGMAA